MDRPDREPCTASGRFSAVLGVLVRLGESGGLRPVKELSLMRPGPARIADGSRRDGAFEVPAAGLRWRAGMFVLAAAAGLALASGVMTGTSDAHAATAVSARAEAAVHAQPMFDHCPCDNPVCRSMCHQGVISGGPASVIHRHTHLAAA